MRTIQASDLPSCGATYFEWRGTELFVRVRAGNGFEWARVLDQARPSFGSVQAVDIGKSFDSVGANLWYDDEIKWL